MQRNCRNKTETFDVGIFLVKNTYRARILSFDIGSNDTEQPIFTRTFSEIVLALGFCNVINQLSKKSVERIMQMSQREL